MIKIISWALIALITLVFFSFKVYFTWVSSEGGATQSILFLIFFGAFIFILFMLEGLQVSLLQLKNTDIDGLNDFLKYSEYGERKQNVIRNTFYVLQTGENFERFVIGRQLFTIFTVVSLTYLLSSLTDNGGQTSPVFTSGYLDQVQSLVNHPIAYFLISSLLPSWIGQLLPQFLSDRRPISFITLPFSSTILSFTLIISKIGAGLPGQWLSQLFFRRLGLFSGKQERIPISPNDVFEKIASYFGQNIEERIFQIRSENNSLVVDEEVLIKFRVDVNDFKYVTKTVGSELIDEFDINTIPGEDGGASVDTSAGEYEVFQIFSYSHGAPKEKIQSTTLLAAFYSIQLKKVPEHIRLKIRYKLNLNQTDEGNELFIENIFPTKKLIVKVSAPSNMMIDKPRCRVRQTDELIIGNHNYELRTLDAYRQSIVIEQKGAENGWHISAKYPPVGSLVKFRFLQREKMSK